LVALLPAGEGQVVQVGIQAVQERMGTGSEAQGGLAVQLPVFKVKHGTVPVAARLPPDQGILPRRELRPRCDLRPA
jgi:hypothetical protein